MTEGTFSLTEDNGLLLNGSPVGKDQVLCFKYGKGEALYGRVRQHPRGWWYLDIEEFIGHPYLNIALTGEFIGEIIVLLRDKHV